MLSLPSPSCYTSYSPLSLFVIRSPDTLLTVQLWGCMCESLCLWRWLEHILHLSYQRYVSLLNWEFKCVCVFFCVCVCEKGFWASLCVLHSNLARVCVCMCERTGVHVSYGHAFETQAVRDTAKRELKDSLCSWKNTSVSYPKGSESSFPVLQSVMCSFIPGLKGAVWPQ